MEQELRRVVVFGENLVGQGGDKTAEVQGVGQGGVAWFLLPVHIDEAQGEPSVYLLDAPCGHCLSKLFQVSMLSHR